MKDFIFILIFSWLFFITYLIFSLKKHYQKLVEHTNKRKLAEILDQLVDDHLFFKKNQQEIYQRLNQLEKKSQLYFQKIGIVRYNPFEERGEKSFVVALLNEKKTGFLLNFIYTRDGLRTYIKKIIDGKVEKGQLSEEEKMAIETSFLKN